MRSHPATPQKLRAGVGAWPGPSRARGVCARRAGRPGWRRRGGVNVVGRVSNARAVGFLVFATMPQKHHMTDARLPALETGGWGSVAELAFHGEPIDDGALRQILCGPTKMALTLSPGLRRATGMDGEQDTSGLRGGATGAGEGASTGTARRLT